MDHAHHGGHGQNVQRQATWVVAAQATLHCLTGCAIGEVVGTAAGWHIAATVVLSIALAFVSATA